MVDVELTPEDRARFLASLKTDKEFRNDVRREVLTEKLLDLPDRMARVEEQIAGLTAAVSAQVDPLVDLGRRVVSLETVTESLVETTGQILVLTQRGFSEMREGFVLMDSKFTRKFDQVEARIESLDSRVESLDGRVESLDTRIESLDSRVESLDTRVESLDTKVTGRLDQIEAEIRDLKKKRAS